MLICSCMNKARWESVQTVLIKFKTRPHSWTSWPSAPLNVFVLMQSMHYFLQVLICSFFNVLYIVFAVLLGLVLWSINRVETFTVSLHESREVKLNCSSYKHLDMSNFKGFWKSWSSGTVNYLMFKWVCFHLVWCLFKKNGPELLRENTSIRHVAEKSGFQPLWLFNCNNVQKPLEKNDHILF